MNNVIDPFWGVIIGAGITGISGLVIALVSNSRS